MNAPLTQSTLKQGQSTDWPSDAVPQRWVDDLFARMSGMYGSKFADLWRGVDLTVVRKMWGQELAKLSKDELKFGVQTLMSRPFPPTLPEFVSLCKPPLNYDAALYEATQQLRLRAEGKDQWSNPAFYWAAIKIGEFDMLNTGHAALIKRFSAALDEVLRGDVAPVPARAIALPAPGRARASKEAVRQAVEKVKSLNHVPGNKEWAKRILEKKDKVTITVRDMALRALKAPEEA